MGSLSPVQYAPFHDSPSDRLNPIPPIVDFQIPTEVLQHLGDSFPSLRGDKALHHAA